MPRKFQRKFRRFGRKTAAKSKMEKRINRKIKVLQADDELKRVDTFQSSNATDTGEIDYLSPFTQGVGIHELVGNEARMTSLHVKGSIEMDDTNLTGSITVRLIAFIDRAPNAANPTVSGINGILDTSVVTEALYAPYNQQMVGKGQKFKILYDKKFTLTPMIAQTTVPATGVVSEVQAVRRYFEINKKLSRKWGAGDATPEGTVGSAYQNGVFFILLSDTPALFPLVNYGSSIYYKDA